MKSIKITCIALLAALSLAMLTPSANADRQSNKNTWRNLAIGSGAVAAYGLLHHDTTTTLLGAAGTAYSANRYEQDRHSQDEAARARARYHRSYYYHRRAHTYTHSRHYHTRYHRR